MAEVWRPPLFQQFVLDIAHAAQSGRLPFCPSCEDQTVHGGYPLCGNDGRFSGAWESPVTSEELDDFFQCFQEIADGEFPAGPQSNWAGMIAQAIARITLAMPTRPTDSPWRARPFSSAPYMGDWEAEMRWGDLAQVLFALRDVALGKDPGTNPQRNWGYWFRDTIWYLTHPYSEE
jgi:hypothetical protein